MISRRRLDQVCEIIMGQAPDGEGYNNDGIGWPLIAGAGDFKQGKLSAKKYTKEASKLSRNGDIILSIRASIGDKVLSDGEYCLGRGVAGLRVSSEIHSRFLWHWLSHIEPTLSAKGKGATFKQVNRVDIGELEIRYPILDEQKRIADILDKADALRAKRRESIELINSLTQSIFLEMFGDISTNSKNWEMRYFEEMCEIESNMVDPTKGEYLNLLHIGGANIESVTGKLVNVKTAQEDNVKSTKFLFKEGSILFSKIRPKLQKVAFPQIKALCSADIYPLTPKKTCTSEYLLSYLRTDYFTAIVSGLAESRSNIPKVNREELSNLRIPCPPLELQKDFSRKFQNLMLLTEHNESVTKVLEELFKSLQQQAFAGEL